MIDTHCHLTSLDVPVEQAIAGLSGVVTVGTNAADCAAAVALSSKSSSVWCALGIHPNSASAASDPEQREAIERLARDARVVAIGETGFDTHWERETLAAQHAAFEWQARLAAELDKPMVLHSRKQKILHEVGGKPMVLHVRDAAGSDGASRAAEAAIGEAGHRRGVLHCFNGDKSLLEAALALGWFVSFAGNLTYKSAAALREAAGLVPLDRLVVETDSPYLTPVPHRGQRNVPSNVRFTAQVLAETRGIEESEMERQLDENAARLFDFGPPAPPATS